MKIGILGGTFDPIRNGHLYIAQETLKRFGLAQIWFMPAAQSPFKRTRQTSPFEQRFQMIRQAVQEIPGCFASPFEGLRGGISYTVDTLQALRRLHPQDRFWFIVGADAFADFFHWKEPEKILQLVELVVVSRPGSVGIENIPISSKSAWAKRVHFLLLPGMHLSSTQIRQNIAENRTYKHLLPPAVADYIQRKGLYQENKR